MVHETDRSKREHPAIFDEVRTMPGHLLRRCHQISVSIFLKKSREWDLTPLQFAVLSALVQSGPLDQARLAGLAALDRTTISVVVRKLEERGLVGRRVSDRDRRSKLISATPDGRRLIDRAVGAVREAQRVMLEPLSPLEQEALLEILAKMADVNNNQSRAPLRDA